jgi:hypothetical protein
MLRMGKQPLVGRSTGSPTLKEAARETRVVVANNTSPLTGFPVIQLLCIYSKT